MSRSARAGQESRDEELEQSADFDEAAARPGAGTGPVKRPGRRDGDEEEPDGGAGKGRRGRRGRRDRERAQREALARARRDRTRKARADLAAKAQGEEPTGDDGAAAADAKGEPAKAMGPAESDSGDAAKGRRLGSKAKAAADADALKGNRPEPEAEAKPKAAAAKGKRRRSKSKPDADAEPAKGERPEPKAEAKPKAGAAKGKRRRSKSKPDADADPAKGERPEPKAEAKPEAGAAAAAGVRRRDRGSRAASGETRRSRDDKRPKARAKDGGHRPRGADAKREGEAAKRRPRRGGAKRAGVRARRAGKGALVALKRGAGEIAGRARKAAPKLARGVFGLIVGAFAIFFTGLGFVLSALIAVYLRIEPPLSALLRLARRAIDAASRQVTPVRVLALVVAGAAVLLALSQFADYRNISIGNDAYADGLQTVAPAPVRETADTGSAHSYLMVPLAAIALILLGAALTGRWRLCRLIALAGIIAITVGLLHDRPAGLDVGPESVAYIGVKATLLGGFYAQLFSGLLLTLSSLLLGRELRLAGAGRRAPAPRRSRARRRSRPMVEGAGA